MFSFVGLPPLEHPDLIKVCLHNGPPCDPDTRSLEPGWAELEGYVAPWISKLMKDVDYSKPVLAEACMYTMTADSNFLLDRLPSSNIVVGAGFSGIYLHARITRIAYQLIVRLLFDG